MDNPNIDQRTSVLAVRHLTESVFVIRFERNGINFHAGQYIVLGIMDHPKRREYSIYSPVSSDYLEVLVQMVDENAFSARLRELRAGEGLFMHGPFGSFRLEETYLRDKNIFIASGTGIAPFHSMVLSYPELNYTILHGVRHLDEGYERETYPDGQYIQCTSADEGSEFYGRVTDYLRKYKPDVKAHYYLCGNSAMIDEVRNLLVDASIPLKSIHAEIYF